MRTGKILGTVVGGLIALFALALLAAWLSVTPNDYKVWITDAVRNATGRELVLQGDIKLSVFPWLALELGPATLGNPPGFGDPPFLSFRHAALRARLLPLLAKRLEVGRVEVDGLDLHLARSADGKGNWEDFGGRSAQSESPPKAGGARSSAAGGGALRGIAGIQLTNARVSYDDITVANLNLETGAFVAQGAVPVSVRADVERKGAEHMSVDARLDVSGDLGAQRLRIAALNLNSVVGAGDERPMRISVAAPSMDLDLTGWSLIAPTVAVNAGGAQLSGNDVRVVGGGALGDGVSVTGVVTLAPLLVREYLPRWGTMVPKTRDPRAWSQVSASSHITYRGNALRFDGLQVTLDDTHLTGAVDVTDVERRVVRFDLSVDRIDVDRYLAPAESGEPVEGESMARRAAESAGKAQGGEEGATTAEGADKAGGTATPWQANGTLAVSSAHWAPMDLSNVRVTVVTHDNVMRLYPLTAQIDEGRYSGDITLDRRGALPVLSLDEHLSGIDVGKLLAAKSKTIHVTGRGNVNLKATGRGAGADAIMKTLNGHFETAVADGTVEGIDLGYELARAEALIRRQDMPAATNTRRTKFEVFKMSAEIANGIAATKDLLISSQVLKVAGQGSANLPAKTVDFSLLADTLRMAGNTPIQIPVKVTGNIADPTVRPDLEALAKGELGRKLREVVEDKLKGLFGRH